MIYLDTSVALAYLLAEDRHPPTSFWGNRLVSSRLLEYELWCRINGRKLAKSHGEQAADLLARVAFVELSRPVLARAIEPFTEPVRTLDALHLASMDFLRAQGQTIQLATYDARLAAAARKMGVEITQIE